MDGSNAQCTGHLMHQHPKREVVLKSTQLELVCENCAPIQSKVDDIVPNMLLDFVLHPLLIQEVGQCREVFLFHTLANIVLTLHTHTHKCLKWWGSATALIQDWGLSNVMLVTHIELYLSNKAGGILTVDSSTS